MFLDGIYNGPNSFSHLLIIDWRKINGRQAKEVRAFHTMIELGRPDEGLAGNAPEVKTIPAQLFSLFNVLLFSWFPQPLSPLIFR